MSAKHVAAVKLAEPLPTRAEENRRAVRWRPCRRPRSTRRCRGLVPAPPGALTKLVALHAGSAMRIMGLRHPWRRGSVYRVIDCTTVTLQQQGRAHHRGAMGAIAVVGVSRHPGRGPDRHRLLSMTRALADEKVNIRPRRSLPTGGDQADSPRDG